MVLPRRGGGRGDGAKPRSGEPQENSQGGRIRKRGLRKASEELRGKQDRRAPRNRYRAALASQRTEHSGGWEEEGSSVVKFA